MCAGRESTNDALDQEIRVSRQQIQEWTTKLNKIIDYLEDEVKITKRRFMVRSINQMECFLFCVRLISIVSRYTRMNTRMPAAISNYILISSFSICCDLGKLAIPPCILYLRWQLIMTPMPPQVLPRLWECACLLALPSAILGFVGATLDMLQVLIG